MTSAKAVADAASCEPDGVIGEKRLGPPSVQLTHQSLGCERLPPLGAGSLTAPDALAGSGCSVTQKRTAVEARTPTGGTSLPRQQFLAQKGPGPLWPCNVVLVASTHCPARSPPTELGLGVRGKLLVDEVSELSQTALFSRHTRSPAMWFEVISIASGSAYWLLSTRRSPTTWLRAMPR